MERVRGEAQVYGQASLHAPNIKNETAILLPALGCCAFCGQEDVLRQRDGGAMGAGRKADGGRETAASGRRERAESEQDVFRRQGGEHPRGVKKSKREGRLKS